jgi:transposase
MIRSFACSNHKAVCDAILQARNGSGETITDVATRFGVSRGWIYKWVYPVLDA